MVGVNLFQFSALVQTRPLGLSLHKAKDNESMYFIKNLPRYANFYSCFKVDFGNLKHLKYIRANDYRQV